MSKLQNTAMGTLDAINMPEWKKELGIPTEMTVLTPIILGVSSIKIPTVPRKRPEIITWK